jgi:hypothetical protein
VWRGDRVFAPLNRERQFLEQFQFQLAYWRRWSVYPAAKPLTFPIQKDGVYVFSCSHYDRRDGLNPRCDAVNSGRACVQSDDCAGRYYNQEARIA